MSWVLIYISTNFLAPIPLILAGTHDFLFQFAPKSTNCVHRFSRKSASRKKPAHRPAKAAYRLKPAHRPAKAGPAHPQVNAIDLGLISLLHQRQPLASIAKPTASCRTPARAPRPRSLRPQRPLLARSALGLAHAPARHQAPSSPLATPTHTLLAHVPAHPPPSTRPRPRARIQAAAPSPGQPPRARIAHQAASYRAAESPRAAPRQRAARPRPPPLSRLLRTQPPASARPGRSPRRNPPALPSATPQRTPALLKLASPSITPPPAIAPSTSSLHRTGNSRPPNRLKPVYIRPANC
jgi:hypothetical protein